jgi:hypothetical protein
MCLNGSETLASWKFQIDWSRKFFEKYKNVPKFGFVFTKMAHEDLNLLNSKIK